MTQPAPWRMYVRLISPQALAEYMKFRRLTNESLAIKCGSYKHRSTISHLRSGTRKTCGPEIARKIADALECPVNALFVAEVPTASQGERRSA
jgi:hypothetical protein